MRITHLLPALDPNHGGVPAAAVRLAAGQAGLGHDVVVADFEPPEDAAAVDRSLEPIPLVNRLRLVRAAASRKEEKSNPPLEACGGADWVHFHGVWTPGFVAIARQLRRDGIPYVLTPHGMLDPWSLAQKRLKKWFAMRLYAKKMLYGAAFIHVLNDDEASLLAPLKLESPTRVVSNGVFFEEIEPLPAAGSFYLRCPALGGAPYVLFLSRLHYKKGLDVLADAFLDLAVRDPVPHLVVVGPDGGAEMSFRDRIRRGGMSDRVHVMGSIYGQQKFEAIRDAACFCLPSRQEGFSLAITEALACGLPVVITHGCHFDEVASAGAGRVTPLDANAVSAALSEVLDDSRLRGEMSVAGRRLVSEHYTWGKVAERMVEYYASATTSP